MRVYPEKTINSKALGWTIGIHILLLLLFFFWRYHIPQQPVIAQDGGMEVNLGSSDNGAGNNQPQDPESPAGIASPVRQASATEAGSLPDMMKNDDAESPTVSTSNNKATVANQTTETARHLSNTSSQPRRQQVAQPQRARYVMQGSNGKGGNGAMAFVPGSSEGNTQGNGDRGVPNGSPGAPNYSGIPGNGTGGVAFSLSGRQMVAYPDKRAEFREGGKVVVRVTVNKLGVIVSSAIASSTNSELSPIALKKLRNVRFNKSDDAPQEQFGTITFIFRAGQ